MPFVVGICTCSILFTFVCACAVYFSS